MDVFSFISSLYLEVEYAFPRAMIITFILFFLMVWLWKAIQETFEDTIISFPWLSYLPQKQTKRKMNAKERVWEWKIISLDSQDISLGATNREKDLEMICMVAPDVSWIKKESMQVCSSAVIPRASKGIESIIFGDLHFLWNQLWKGKDSKEKWKVLHHYFSFPILKLFSRIAGSFPWYQCWFERRRVSKEIEITVLS